MAHTEYRNVSQQLLEGKERVANGTGPRSERSTPSLKKIYVLKFADNYLLL